MCPKYDNGSDYAPDGSHLSVAPHYWSGLTEKETNAICNFTFFDPIKKGRWQFEFLNETVQIDFEQRCLLRRQGELWHQSKDPLLTLITVIYLYHINGVYPLGQDMVGIKDLKEGHFFTGPHELRTAPLIERFENNLDGFCRAGKALNGKPLEMADAAFELRPFPRLPLYFLMWCGDAEFEPRLQVLLARSTENFLPADAIWALINRVIKAFTDISI